MTDFIEGSRWDYSDQQSYADNVEDVRAGRWLSSDSSPRLRYPRFERWQLARSASQGRRSVRLYEPVPFPEDRWSRFLELIVDGCHDAPSAGAVRGVEVHCVVRDVGGEDLWHLDPVARSITRLWPLEPSWRERVFPGQPWAAAASAVVLLSANRVPYREIYQARGERFALLEAGYYSAVVDGAAEKLDLATCLIGGFSDDELADVLNFSAGSGLSPLLAVTVGVGGSPG